MVSFPNCKLNLGLCITAKRADGFHALETIFYPLNIFDVLEINPQAENVLDVHFSATGLKLDSKDADNLCIKAYNLLKKDFSQMPAVKMHLHKAIPAGAGLGGGSADATAALRMLNFIFDLNISEEKLVDYALYLGSDCPFFINNTPCFATGRGEKLEQIALSLSGYKFLVVFPDLHINTSWAFSHVKPSKPAEALNKIVLQQVNTWKKSLINDFEKPVFNLYPQLKSVKKKLYAMGAVYAGMSGSGSTFFGIFPCNYSIKTEAWPPGYFVWELNAE